MSHQAILQRHDPLCPAANAPCSCDLCNPYCTCDSLRAAYRRGREDADHGDCICTQVEGQLWRDGSLRWLYVDGVKFVPAAARGEACTCSCHPEAALCCLRCMKAHDIAAARGDSTKCIPKQSQSVSQGREDYE